MSSAPKIKFAVVGLGHIGKRHAEMITRHPEAELVCVCDVRPESETGFNQAGVAYFSDLEQLLFAHPEVDVVNICTPNGLHVPQSLTVLAQHRHVVCEKPMGLTKRSCEEVIFKALQVSKHVFIVMQNRYSPPSRWLKEVVTKKLLGELFLVQINCYWNRDERYYKPGGWKGTNHLDGGTLFTQFSHFIDIMYWLFGDIEDISGRFADFTHNQLTEFEDTGLIQFQFVNGGMGVLNYSTSTWDANLESSMTIIGEKGSIKVGGQYMNEVVHCHIDGYTMPELEPIGPANDYGHYKGSAANHHQVIANVIDTLQNRTVATTNALEGLKVVEIIERIYQVRDRKK